MSGEKNERCLWRVGRVGEVYKRRTEVTKIESIDSRVTQVSEGNGRDSLK